MKPKYMILVVAVSVLVAAGPVRAADSDQPKVTAKEKFDLIFNKVFSTVGTARTIGEGYNDIMDPGRQAWREMDDDDPMLQDWIRRKEEKQRERERSAAKFKEMLDKFSNFGGTQETIVPDHAKGENRLKDLFEGEKQTTRPPSMISALPERERSSAEPQRNAFGDFKETLAGLEKGWGDLQESLQENANNRNRSNQGLKLENPFENWKLPETRRNDGRYGPQNQGTKLPEFKLPEFKLPDASKVEWSEFEMPEWKAPEIENPFKTNGNNTDVFRFDRKNNPFEGFKKK